MKNRVSWMEQLRFLSALLVFCTHFTVYFSNEIFRKIWRNQASIMKGFSGKFAVAMFCVLLGYFSAKKAFTEKNTTTATYIAKRYISLAFPTLVVNGIYFIIYLISGNAMTDKINIEKLISESFFFTSNNINAITWCMTALLMGSLMVYVICKLRLSITCQVLIAGAFMAFGNLWVGTCILGSISFILLNNTEITGYETDGFRKIVQVKWIMKILENPLFQIVFLMCIYMAINRLESKETYIWDSIACMAILIIITYSKWMQRILTILPTYKLGTITFEFYLLQIPVLNTFRPLYNVMQNWQIQHETILFFLITLLTTILLSFAIHCLLKNRIQYLSDQITNRKFMEKKELV